MSDMKSVILLRPTFSLSLNKKIVDILMYCSSLHYDTSCNAASKQGGFIYGWKNIVGMGFDPLASFRELDLTIKILESYTGAELPAVIEYRNLVRDSINASNALSLKPIEVLNGGNNE